MKPDFCSLARGAMTLAVMVLFILTSPEALADKQDWQGQWKINNKSQYATISIDKVTDNGFAFFYDEGIGIQGNKINGQASFKDEFTASIIVENVPGADTDQCKLVIKLTRSQQGKQLVLLNCELNYYAASKDGYRFVPKATKLYYKAGFNCARAGTRLELAICHSRILAAADIELGRLYHSLKKQLNAKSKKRLIAEQKKWLKDRNKQCKNLTGDSLNFCLRNHYGLRLLNLHALKKYKLWITGSPNYINLATIHAAHKKAADKSELDLLAHGLGLWLGSFMKRGITDSGGFNIETAKLDNNRYIMLGPYFSDPSQGYDPASADDRIYLEFSAQTGIWAGTLSRGGLGIYIPKNKSLPQASNEMKSWLKQNQRPPQLHKVF